MPIEIKELHIKVNVDENETRVGSNNSTLSSKDEIIEACVEQVLEILSKKEER